VTSARTLVPELIGNLVLHWFMGLDLDMDPWSHSTFSQKRKRWVMASGLLEQWFDETLAVKQELVSMHTTLDGTPLPVNASQMSLLPIETFEAGGLQGADPVIGSPAGLRPRQFDDHISRGALLESDACVDDHSQHEIGQ
jgi:hypothetical protein